MTSRYSALVAAAVVALACACARAQPHAGDILLEQVGGKVSTGQVDADTGELIHGVRVFGATFSDSFTNNPGFDTVEGAFPPASQLGFNIRKALRVWDSAGPGFDEIPTERIQVKLGPLGPILTPTTDTSTPGFGIAVSSDGRYHHHLGYALLAPAGTGIYLLELEMWSSSPSIATSDPFWLVFNQNEPVDEHQTAIQWVVDHLASPCIVDLNGDGVVDFADYLEFLNLFDAQDPRVDFNHDGVVDFADYLEFLNLFDAGC
ncbi:MAG: hypothetical protein IT436_18810 [Phycisphaerales bacterium]|nr:hypothetical protein [Phycisphaerales bacterium]